MHRREIQSLIIERELAAAVRRGEGGTSAREIPILVMLADIHRPLEAKTPITALINLCCDEGRITPRQAKIAQTIYADEDGGQARSVTERIRRVCVSENLTEENFNRRVKPKLLKDMAEFLGSLVSFLNITQRGDLDTSLIPEELRAKLNAFDFLSKNADRICRQYYYRAGLRDLSTHYACETLYERVRKFPTTPYFRVYLCRTYEGMQAAIADGALIGLECAEMDEDLWSLHARDFNCTVSIRSSEKTVLSRKQTPEYVIFEYERGDVGADADSLSLACNYSIGPTVRRFPVKLINHFTAGSIRVEFSLESERYSTIEIGDYFVGFDGKTPYINRRIEKSVSPAGRSRKAVSVTIPPETVIWPGSGMEIFW